MATVSDLGHRARFRIGQAEIRPTVCEVVGPGGTEAVEPRVMQVLVALAEAGGETVTRDDLVRLCWSGRIVGDDAINRVILKIRKIAEGVAAGSFTIRTVPKIGYRLCEAEVTEVSPSIEPESAREPKEAWLRPSGPKEKRPWRAAWWASAFAVAAAAGVAWTALESGSVPQAERPGPGAASLDPAARDLALRARAAAFEGTPEGFEQALGYFRRAVERSPHEAGLWGGLAMIYIFNSANLPPAQQSFAAKRARQAARRSLELNPHEGHALAAQVIVEPNFRNWARQEAAFRRAIALSDQGSPAPIFHGGRFLASAGRTEEALARVARASKLNPLVPFIVTAHVNLLVASGRVEEAEQIAEAAAALWPRSYELWLARFFLHAFNGEPDAAAALTEPARWPQAARPSDMALMRRAAEAIASGSPAQADAVLADYEKLAREGQSYAEQGMRFAAYFGRTDKALKFAEQLYLAPDMALPLRRHSDHIEYGLAGERYTAPLFAAPADKLWTEPRFMALMQKIGLVDYWRRSGAPDLCREPRMREICRRWRLEVAEAAAGAEAAARAGARGEAEAAARTGAARARSAAGT
jgi:DNA-binding winged helix-turn-helix (wHTH) protein